MFTCWTDKTFNIDALYWLASACLIFLAEAQALQNFKYSRIIHTITLTKMTLHSSSKYSGSRQ